MPNNPAIFHERYFAILLRQKQDTGGLLNSNFVLREFLAINKLQVDISRSFSNILSRRCFSPMPSTTISRPTPF